MKKIVTVIVFSLSNAIAFAQTECGYAKSLVEIIQANHVDPVKTDDAFSERVFTGFLDLLDPDHKYFNKNDSILLSPLKYQIDDLILSGNCNITENAAALYKKKIIAYKSFVDSLLQRPLNFNTPDRYFIIPSGHDMHFANTLMLNKRRTNEIKYQTLLRAWRMAEMKNETLSGTNFPLYEKLAREKIKDRTARVTKAILYPAEGFDHFVSVLLLKAISFSFDPHTEYMSPADLKSFEMLLSTSGLSFGFELTESQTGELQIARLSPGGSAWKSDVLKAGDVLISMQAKDGPVMEAADFELEEMVEKLTDMNIPEMDITVRKDDGQMRTVKLRKEKVENTDNLIDSFILQDTKKVGYISLPGFYADFNDPAHLGCANDVAREIIKLKKEGIEGLILDLRFNGGGSVEEAVELAGIFIDAGPMAVVQQKGDQFSTLKDMNRGSVFEGPLVVMINSFSASASELVAAGLQDYNRAVIVGSSSFGKATGQEVLPAESVMGGSVKVTIGRISRISGNSLQMTGVIPDIPLPDITSALIEKEAALKYPLQPKKISKKVYYTPVNAPPLFTIQETSSNRIAENSYYKKMKNLGQALIDPVPLEVVKFIAYMKNLESLSNLLSEVSPQQGNYKVYNSGSNTALLAIDSYHRELNENSLKDIRNSSYILETYNIVLDLLNNKK